MSVDILLHGACLLESISFTSCRSALTGAWVQGSLSLKQYWSLYKFFICPMWLGKFSALWLCTVLREVFRPILPWNKMSIEPSSCWRRRRAMMTNGHRINAHISLDWEERLEGGREKGTRAESDSVSIRFAFPYAHKRWQTHPRSKTLWTVPNVSISR